jgi:hypothetical protein
MQPGRRRPGPDLAAGPRQEPAGGGRVAAPDAETLAGDVADWIAAHTPGLPATAEFRRRHVAALLPGAEQALAGGRALGLSREQVLAGTLAAFASHYALHGAPGGGEITDMAGGR